MRKKSREQNFVVLIAAVSVAMLTAAQTPQPFEVRRAEAALKNCRC